VEEAILPTTRLVWAETPSNPQLTIIDLEALASVARSTGVQMVVDNTWSTPLITRPIEHGADIVLHSVTKYLGGHSDVLGGALVFAREGTLLERASSLSDEGGAVLDPFGAWLAMRGMRSLAPRLRHQSASALALATWLEHHGKVEAVHYPGLESHPAYDTARKQMALGGGMLSFQVKGDAANALRTVQRCRLFANATSLGGTESLIEHRASVEGADSPTPDNLLRVSVGLEQVDDLIADLEHALAG
jgi:cystathionine gamma-synthase